MAQLPLPEILATFLSRHDAKALFFVSRSAAPENPLTLQEQLLVMTRRANAGRLQFVSYRHATWVRRGRSSRDYERRVFETTGMGELPLEPPLILGPREGEQHSCTDCGHRGFPNNFHRIWPDCHIVCGFCLAADPTKVVMSRF